ncbi:hypothetical protein Tco_1230120 [Tanacetum coccineum]
MLEDFSSNSKDKWNSNSNSCRDVAVLSAGGQLLEPAIDTMDHTLGLDSYRDSIDANHVDEITILKTNTPYPSRKIRRIRACTHQRPQRNKDQYAVSRENQYAVFKIWNQYNILEDIKRGPYSKKSPIRRIQHLDTPYPTDFQTL